uniref:Uncharacterized protein n=1 Tax=Arundo donax TaxID=35708 RepID=A0A0A9BBF5_ARUDO
MQSWSNSAREPKSQTTRTQDPTTQPTGIRLSLGEIHSFGNVTIKRGWRE